MNTVEKLQKLLAYPEVEYRPGHFHRYPAPRITCKDGLGVSVQASRNHYSIPRGSTGPWSHVELGFPSKRPNDAVMAYAENEENPTGTVYAYVPIEIVAAWLDECGGIVEPDSEGEAR